MEASKTAIIIAEQDQESGNYRSARDILFTMHQELKEQQTAIPFEMANSLMLLHSYILVKVQIKLNNHVRIVEPRVLTSCEHLTAMCSLVASRIVPLDFFIVLRII
jgi:hypothetical protein